MAVALEQPVLVPGEITFTSSGVAIGTLTGVTAGSAIVVCTTKAASGTRTWTIADDVNGAYDERANEVDGNGNGRKITIHTVFDVGAGDTVITLTSSANIGLICAVYEVSGVGAIPTFVASTISATSGDVDGTGYPCSVDTTVIDTTAAAFICSCACFNADPVDVVAGSGFTLDEGGGSNREAIQSGIFASAQTDNRCWFGEGGTNRHWGGGCLALEEEAAPPGGLSIPIAMHNYRMRVT